MELILFFVFFLIIKVNGHINLEIADTAFDQNLYEQVLDPEECHRQIRFIRENSILALRFQDAGFRTPRGLLYGNSVDLGNYHQCLGISLNTEGMDIQGKYCAIRVPMNQTFHLPSQDTSTWFRFNPSYLAISDETQKKFDEYAVVRSQLQALTGIWNDEESRTSPVGPLVGTVLRVAVCIPKPCTTEQAITSFLFNLTSLGFQYTDEFCRLPNDKPWAPADYVAIVVFSLIGILTVLSTSYDLFHTFVLKEDRKKLNTMYQSFSVYTNGKRLMTFTSGADNLQCLDGIRSLAMMWVILGHCFSTQRFIMNNFDLFQWLFSLNALWITSATITVDTFFTLGGLLLVYTTARKLSRVSLIKNLHLFYLNRILRMAPLLGTVVLLQASYFNRMLDGPFWTTVSRHTNVCRTYWWTTMLHVQNLLNPGTLCITHSWYVAIDVQLYIVSPLVLFWVLGDRRRDAWVALAFGLLVPLTAATIYNFLNNFPAGTLVPSRPGIDAWNYMSNYYFNTLTRAAPFFVGMIFGYVLHVNRKKKVQIPWVISSLLWVCALSITNCIFLFVYFIKQFDWDNQLVDNLMNSFMRPAWAMALGWIIFACVHGYGEPVNWFLTLDIWKVPARLSYGMFLFHYPLMFVIGDSATSTNYFSVAGVTFQFLAHYTLSLIVSFVLTLLIDSPFSTICKKILGSQQNKPQAVIGKDTGDSTTNTKDIAAIGLETNKKNGHADEEANEINENNANNVNGVNHMKIGEVDGHNGGTIHHGDEIISVNEIKDTDVRATDFPNGLKSR